MHTARKPSGGFLRLPPPRRCNQQASHRVGLKVHTTFTPPMSTIKRSAAVPLTLVSTLAAAVGCGGPALAPGEADPCLPQNYAQSVCETAVQQGGYHYGGAWYPHVYAYAPLFYYNGYSRYVATGGRVRAISPSVYSPNASRSSVVRGGFGGIGSARGFGGS
jgi:hypothetical protein